MARPTDTVAAALFSPRDPPSIPPPMQTFDLNGHRVQFYSEWPEHPASAPLTWWAPWDDDYVH